METVVKPSTTIGCCLWLLACAALLATLGCSRDTQIRGEVTLDGKPLAKGAIRLSPLDGQAPTAGAAIQDGKFTVLAVPTKYRVEIAATMIQGSTEKPINKFANNDNLIVVSLIPERYNVKSELTLDVQSGLNEPRFDLHSR
jgi:hypothetical protein